MADPAPPAAAVRDALARLELVDGATADEVRASYRRAIRTQHPDVATTDPDAPARTAALIAAYEVLVAHLEHHGTDRVTVADGDEPRASAAPPGPTPTSPRAHAAAVTVDDHGEVEARSLDEDTIAVDLPPPETYAALHEAASRVGEIAYVDRNLGIIETIVRFEGGPTCSVVLTLQGRAHHTEIFCTMTSIEAAPTPPIAPVIDALVEALERL